MGFDAQFRLTRLPDGRWRADAPGVTIMASTFEEAVERARGPSGAVNGVAAGIPLQNAVSGHAERATRALTSGVDKSDPASYRAALARGVWWG